MNDEAADTENPEPLPPGWRPEWRSPRPRGGSRAREAEGNGDEPEAQRAPLSRAQLREGALRVLFQIASDRRAQPAARVGACNALLDATRDDRGWRSEDEGDPRKLLVMYQLAIGNLERRIAEEDGKRPPELQSGAHNG